MKKLLSDRSGRVLSGLFAVACAVLGFAVSAAFAADPRMSSAELQSAIDDAPRGDAQSVTGSLNGHDYVDLGLSVKWATCNVCAEIPSDYGYYFAWGQTAIKSAYDEKDSKTDNKNIGDIAGKARYDAARVNWGDAWRMPTHAEMQELIDKCTWTWTNQDGHNGYKVTSKINGNHIFLPAAGSRIWSSFYNAGEVGYYWCSTPCKDFKRLSYCLYFGSSFYKMNSYSRNYGLNVRPVLE